MLKYKLVQGVQDYLPEDFAKKVALERKIENIFDNFGYKPVQSPTLEHHDIFTSGDSIAPFNQLFKTSDTDGNLLVLRSDMTTPISRIVSTKMKADFPLRLSYIANSFKLKVEKSKLREFTQAGVELFGVNSPFADAEVIALAIDTLKSTGLTDFLIDIGQVNILKGFLNTTKLTQKEKQEIMSLVDKKSLIEDNLIKGLSEKECTIINSIVRLFGDADVLDEAKAILDNQESLEALANLKEVYEILQNMGYEDYISFDLGIVNTYTYYTGTVFKGITKYFGSPILSGGRYDTLTHIFDKDIPATGFAIGINNLMQALDKIANEPLSTNRSVAVGMARSANSESAYKKVCDSIIAKGFTIDYSYTDNLPSLEQYAKDKGISLAIFIQENGVSKEVAL